MISVHQYTISDLKNGVMTNDFARSKIIPVSSLRLASYCENPAARNEDFVLFAAMDGNECVAFRTVMPDFLNGKDGKVRVAWFSGNWVRDDMRRKGLSTQLFYTIREAWGDYLIFTNYAPVSEQLYLKSGLFKPFYRRAGTRLYIKPPFLLIAKNKEYPVLYRHFANFFDQITSFPFALTIKKLKKLIEGVETTKSSNSLITNTLPDFLKNSLSYRTKQEFQWIFDFPWIEEGETEKTYPFSWKFKNYHENAYYIHSKEKTDVNGIMVGRIKDSVATIPFYKAKNSTTGRALLDKFIADCVELNVIYVTFFNTELSLLAKDHKIFKKTVVQYYYSTDVVIDQLPSNHEIAFQDGDGDAAFV